MNSVYKRTVAVVLLALLVSITCPSPVFAGKSPEKEARFAQKVKKEISKLGTGPNARVELELKDKSKLKGYVSEVSDESFVVVDDQTGAATTIFYPQVLQLLANHPLTKKRMIIAAGLVLAGACVVGALMGGR